MYAPNPPVLPTHGPNSSNLRGSWKISGHWSLQLLPHLLSVSPKEASNRTKRTWSPWWICRCHRNGVAPWLNMDDWGELCELSPRKSSPRRVWKMMKAAPGDKSKKTHTRMIPTGGKRPVGHFSRQFPWRWIPLLSHFVKLQNGDHGTRAGATWRIIPVSKWLITMVSKSPRP